MERPHAVIGGRADEPVDPRVAAVLDVLRGRTTIEVSRKWKVDPALLHRWVRDFVAAGTAQVTNRPGQDDAHQRDRFLAAFAHEVRTPLSVARGWAAMLADEEVPQAQVRESLRRLSGAIDRLTERTFDVELMAAASLGRLTLRPRPVTVAWLVEELEGLDEVSGAELELTVDAPLFRRVVRDLWEAAGAHPVPRSRRIEVLVEAPWVELRVVRDADPIDPEVLRALFEPFDLNDDGTGVTIGLYLARALTVAHGGSVGVDQDEDGAALWVRVPLDPRSGHPTAPGHLHDPTPEETP